MPKVGILNIRCDYQFVFSVLDKLYISLFERTDRRTYRQTNTHTHTQNYAAENNICFVSRYIFSTTFMTMILGNTNERSVIVIALDSALLARCWNSPATTPRDGHLQRAASVAAADDDDEHNDDEQAVIVGRRCRRAPRTSLHTTHCPAVMCESQIQRRTQSEVAGSTACRVFYIGWHDRSWTILNGKLTMLELLNIY